MRSSRPASGSELSLLRAQLAGEPGGDAFVAQQVARETGFVERIVLGDGDQVALYQEGAFSFGLFFDEGPDEVSAQAFLPVEVERLFGEVIGIGFEQGFVREEGQVLAYVFEIWVHETKLSR